MIVDNLKYPSEGIEKIEKRIESFLKDRSVDINRNLDDLKQSRSLSSGFGISEKDREYRQGKAGATRAEVTINVVEPWISSVVASYDDNPFGVSVKSHIPNIDTTQINTIFDTVKESNNLTDISTQVLKDALYDGYGYALVYNDLSDPTNNLQDIKIEVQDNNAVFFDDCKDPTGKDCEYAIIFGTIRKSKANSKWGLDETTMRYIKDIACEYSLVKDSTNYYSLITTYELTEDGVLITKLCAGRVVEEPVLLTGLKRLPIVRNIGSKVWLGDDKDIKAYRGAYWKVFDILRTLNFQGSSYLERIALNPPIRFLTDPKATSNYSEQYKNSMNMPMAELNYDSKDKDGSALPAPIQVNNAVDTSDLTSGITLFSGLAQSILGTPTGQATSNETAESVLQRKFANEANANSYLKNLKMFEEGLGQVILEMIPILFDVPRSVKGNTLQPVMDISNLYVDIDSGPMLASTRQKNVAQLLALNSLTTATPEYAGKVIPVIVENLDLPDNQKQYLMGQFMPQQQQQQLPPEVVAQMQAKDQQVAQMQEMMQQQSMQLSRLENALIAEESKIQAMITKAMIDKETKIQVESIKQQGSDQRLMAELQADAEANTTDAMLELAKLTQSQQSQEIVITPDYAPNVGLGVPNY